VEPLDDSILDDFLVDSHEGLERLDRDLVALEQASGRSGNARDAHAAEALSSAFRSLHTIKGTCSFFGFRRLERVAHAGESLLADLRAGRLELTPAIVDGLLATVDAVRGILTAIESTRHEPDGDDAALFAQLAPWRRAATAPAEKAPAATAPRPELRSGTPAPAATALQQQYLRVDVRRLDEIMDLVGELVLARNQLVQSVTSVAGSPVAAAAQRVDHVTDRLQDEVMRTRMQPVSALWARLPRLVRDVATACGKRVRLELSGDETELDRTIVEALKDPLTHLVRNAVDHGLEDAAGRERAGKPAEGVLRLRAYEEGGSVHLLLADDGAGMSLARIREKALTRGLTDRASAERLTDQEWLQFVFLPGFSTAAKVTNISGRGVGLDAARAAIEAVGGEIDVRSAAGTGTTFHIRLPLTLAIIPALTVEQSGECYVVPQAHVLELVRCGEGSGTARIETVHDRPMFRLRGELLPVVSLSRLIGAAARPGAPAADAAADARHLLVLSAAGVRIGLAVERVRDTEDIVVKPVGRRLRESGLFAGATVRGDGRVALILDVHAIAGRSAAEHAAQVDTAAGAATAAHAESDRRARAIPLLLVRARRGVPAAVRVAEVERIVEFESGAFERLGERPAVRLDGEVLPIRSLDGDPLLAGPEALSGDRPWPVLVHSLGGRRQGLVVDAVEDIVEWDGGLPHPAARGRAASGGAERDTRIVLNDHITDLVTLSGDARGAA